MRSVVLDELKPSEIERLRKHLANTLVSSRLPGVFWLELPPDLLSPEQMAHHDTCSPFRVALILEKDALHLELLVRTHASLHCTCSAFANKAQRDFLLSFLDRLVAEAGIKS